MLILKIALRNVVRHRSRSLVIIALIAFCTALFVLGNAALSSSARGIKESFVQSFTGDFSISARADTAFSLFGNEVPIVGDYEITPPLLQHDEIQARMRGLPDVGSVVSVISGAAQLNVYERRTPTIFFGVEGRGYFEAFPSIRLVRGDFLEDGQTGVVLNAAQAADIEKLSGKAPAIGDMALFTVTNDSGFMLRQAPIRGIFSYSSSNDTLDRICLLDAATARSLAGYIAGNARTKDEAPVVSGNIDALFDSDASASVEASGSVDLAKVEGALADTSSRDAAFSSEGGAWNFILVRAKDGVSLSRLETSLSAEIKSGGFSVRLLDWRGTAGTQAQMIYALRIIFNAGIVILSFAAIIIIINSLTISTLERSAEIGTMRAIGASKAFVSRLFIAETTMVTVLGAVVGVALGGVVAFLIGRTGIRLTNSLLVSLFGGATLRPSMSLGDAFLYLAVALAMGAVAWIYPVRLVLRCTPLQAMNKAE